MQEAKVENMNTTSNLPATQEDVRKMQPIVVQAYELEITMDEVRKYIAPNGTPQELYTFGRICRVLNLDPFKKEIYFVKYGSQTASIVVGYSVYLKRAERTGKLNGWSVKMDKDDLGEKAVVTIHRTDWDEPFEWEAYRQEFDKKQSTWKAMPIFMLKKCAIAQAFRLCFPDELGGYPYIPEEIGQSETQYADPAAPQLSEARVTSASPVDIDYLRGQYFKHGDWADDDARHEWNVANGFKESVKEWEVRDFERAIDILDPAEVVNGRYTVSETEAERMEAELGKDDATEEVVLAGEDGAQGTSDATDAPDPAMESAEALQGEIQTRLDRISELLPTSISGYDTPAFRTWAWGLLDDDLKGTPIHELGVLDLDILIGAMEARDDKQADESAGENGLF